MKRKRVGRRRRVRRRVRRGRMGRPRTSLQRGLPSGSRPELKSIDVTFEQAQAGNALIVGQGATDFGPDFAPGYKVVLLNPCIEGSSLHERIGRQIVMKSLLLRLCMMHEAGTVTTTTEEYTARKGNNGCIRFMVVYDTMTNHAASLPASSAVLMSKSDVDGTPAASQADATVRITSPVFLDARERFRILYDKLWCWGGQAVHTKHWKKFRRINLPVQYNQGAAQAVSDIEIGALYLMTWCTFQVAPSAVLQSRIRFVDS